MHIWHVSDGRAGHDRQVQALLRALSAITDVSVATVAPLSWPAALGVALRRRPSPGRRAPDLVVGAGHETHAALLAVRRAHGAPCIVLMRPSLPLSWFDLCVIPRHDRPPARANVIETLGPLSPVVPSGQPGGKGLILLGGPSRHFRWSDRAVLTQIATLVAADPERRWLLSTSRRTPASLLASMSGELRARLEVAPVGSQPAGWLDETLPASGCCWITADSVSMIFDALSAGVPCGVFGLPARRGSRVAAAVDELVAEGRILRFRPERPDTAPSPAAPLREADRVAERVLERVGA